MYGTIIFIVSELAGQCMPTSERLFFFLQYSMGDLLAAVNLGVLPHRYLKVLYQGVVPSLSHYV